MNTRAGLWGPILLLFVGAAHAEILDAKHINRLQFGRNGRIDFSLFITGSTGEKFKCVTGGSTFFSIAACPATDSGCHANVSRMASLLLSAKLAGKAVIVDRNACEVTSVALQP